MLLVVVSGCYFWLLWMAVIALIGCCLFCRNEQLAALLRCCAVDAWLPLSWEDQFSRRGGTPPITPPEVEVNRRRKAGTNQCLLGSWMADLVNSFWEMYTRKKCTLVKSKKNPEVAGSRWISMCFECFTVDEIRCELSDDQDFFFWLHGPLASRLKPLVHDVQDLFCSFC